MTLSTVLDDGSPRGRPNEVRLARLLVSLADTLVDDFDVVDLMDRLVHSCLGLVNASAAGLLLLDQRGGLQLVASSSEETRLLELFQLQTEQGPCLDCVATGAVVTVDDLSSASSRWPRFTQAAALVGYRSVHALPLRLRSEVIGSLNLFRSTAPQLTLHEQEMAQALADVATIGILQQRSVHRGALLAEQLQTALHSRITIEQAKGILAEHARLSMDDAYQTLRSFARDHNLKLTEVADGIVAGHLRLEDVTTTGGRTRSG
jgi:GAF domain-containing protein